MISKYFTIFAEGNRNALMALNAELGLKSSILKELKLNPFDSTAQIDRWSWSTEKIFCKTDFPTDEIEAYLEQNAILIAILKKHSQFIRDVGVALSWNFRDEQLNGFSVSKRFARILSDANMSFDIDII
jgi:hypothetical protein